MRTIIGTMLLALCAAGGAASAASLTFGQWRVATSADGHYTYAATVNHRGEVFGEFCDFKSVACRWLLAVHSPCRFGDVYPVLANSAAGANPIAIFCVGALGGHTYGMALMNPRKLEASIAHARRIAFAVPLHGGGFAFTRFALAGRLHATALLQKALAAELARRRRSGLAQMGL
jgi:hypothetical protein